jgi:hypothetical protein
MSRILDRGAATGWPVKPSEVFRDDENSLAPVRYWGERYCLCSFSSEGNVEWVASDVPRLLNSVMRSQPFSAAG